MSVPLEQLHILILSFAFQHLFRDDFWHLEVDSLLDTWRSKFSNISIPFWFSIELKMLHLQLFPFGSSFKWFCCSQQCFHHVNWAKYLLRHTYKINVLSCHFQVNWISTVDSSSDPILNCFKMLKISFINSEVTETF